jgi:uncharacterized membrane protein YgcG
MDFGHYRFHALWALPVPPAVVYRVLEQVEEYPRWWPQVREVRRMSGTAGVMRIRSVLPYDLTFTATELRRDPEAGILEIAVSGDIEGVVRWEVTAHGAGCRARFQQECDLVQPGLRRLSVLCRPFFRANHTLMMRAGRRGLSGRLGRGSGGRSGGGGKRFEPDP